MSGVGRHKTYLWQQLVPRTLPTGLGWFFSKHRTPEVTLHDQNIFGFRPSGWEGADLSLVPERHENGNVGLFLFPHAYLSAWPITGTQLIFVKGLLILVEMMAQLVFVGMWQKITPTLNMKPKCLTSTLIALSLLTRARSVFSLKFSSLKMGIMVTNFRELQGVDVLMNGTSLQVN